MAVWIICLNIFIITILLSILFSQDYLYSSKRILLLLLILITFILALSESLPCFSTSDRRVCLYHGVMLIFLLPVCYIQNNMNSLILNNITFSYRADTSIPAIPMDRMLCEHGLQDEHAAGELDGAGQCILFRG